MSTPKDSPPRLTFPPLMMEADGEVEEAERARMTSVLTRLHLWLQFLDWRLGESTPKHVRKLLWKRRRNTLAAITALAKLVDSMEADL